MATLIFPAFDLDKNDKDCVRGFLESLDGFFENFVNDPFNFSDWLEKSARIGNPFFKSAWEETKKYSKKALKYFDYLKEDGTLLKKLEDIGFTKNNLKSKGTIFNGLCSKLKQYIDILAYEGKELFSFLFNVTASTANIRLPFYTSPFFVLFKDMLSYLNSLLGSLTKVIPPLEVIKEFKEQIEALMDLDRESRSIYLRRE